jgi:hypothetical protein
MIKELLKPIFKEIYQEGYRDGERRILNAFEYGWQVGHSETMAALGEIDIEEISAEEFEKLAGTEETEPFGFVGTVDDMSLVLEEEA